jgi:hypothetical protein
MHDQASLSRQIAAKSSKIRNTAALRLIRMQAKREALEAVWRNEQEASRKSESGELMPNCPPALPTALAVEGQPMQKSPQGVAK